MDQAEVIAFLSHPSTYALKDRVERFETHISLIFLAGPEAWKIKRPVRFAYLDFTTLERRHAACMREIEVNRRFARDIYLDCVPITRSPRGGLQFAGSGEIVEWAVHMRRFEQSALLGNVAREAAIPPEMARRVADAVLASHRAADKAAPGAGAARMRQVLTALSQALAHLDVFDATAVADLCAGQNTSSPASSRRWSNAPAAAACGAATATFISATSCSGMGSRSSTTQSNSTRSSPPSIRCTTWRSC